MRRSSPVLNLSSRLEFSTPGFRKREGKERIPQLLQARPLLRARRSAPQDLGDYIRFGTGLVEEHQPANTTETYVLDEMGNFVTRSTAHALDQLRMLAPYASTICHAKDGIANEGKFYPDDFAASMKVMRDAHFNGIYSLEYEGLDEPSTGIKKLIGMVEEQLSY